MKHFIYLPARNIGKSAAREALIAKLRAKGFTVIKASDLPPPKPKTPKQP